MNSAKTLYSILNIIIFLILLSISLGVIFFILIFFEVTEDPVGLTSDFFNHKNDAMLYVFMTLTLAVYAIFVAGIWKLRDATKLLLNKKFYTVELINAIIFSGKSMVVVGVFSWFIDGLSGIYFKHVISIGISEKTFVYLFIMAMGMFLMLMGTVIKDAKTIKEDNDLTI